MRDCFAFLQILPKTELGFPNLRLAIFLLLFCPTAAVCAATPVQTQESPDFSPRITLVTILPGRSLYSAFGHSAIRVSYPNGGPDLLYNYGLSAKPFDLRFALGMLVGRMPFMAASLRTADAYEFYSEVEDRAIIEQVLALGRDDAAALITALEEDTQPGRNTYNYRYFSNNCATRPWLRLEPYLVTPSQQGAGVLEGTMRDHLRLALHDRPWLSFGIDLLLGPNADKGGTEVGPFLPEQLRSLASASAVIDMAGSHPAVSETITVFTSRSSVESPNSRAPLVAIRMIGALASIASFLPSSYFARLLDAGMFTATSVGALVLCAFWLLAGYEETGWNLNLLWMNPIALLALILAERSRAIPASRVFFVAAILSFVVVIGGGLGVQQISLEARIMAAVIALRCMARSRLFPIRATRS